jgi:SAM-dependent methyltransferase
MGDSEPVAVYDSQSSAYHRAFQVFLDHTDQKAKAREWLDRLVEGLPSRQVFIDAGAGNGKVTAWYLDRFQRTIAVEPNPSLCAELRRTCSTAEVVPEAIMHSQPAASGDLVLCSHVFYYIDRARWMPDLEKLTSWLSPDGVLVVVLQNHRTDCMRMLEHFHGERFSLRELADSFRTAWGNRYHVDLETVPAQVVTADPASAYTVAEFMLNLLPMPRPPARRALEDYVWTQAADPDGGFRFSCDQDFLSIRPRFAGGHAGQEWAATNYGKACLSPAAIPVR